MKQFPKVTDHLVLRYAERIEGFDVKKRIRKLIIEDLETPRIRQAIELFGNAAFKIKSAKGITYCFRDRTITTCYPSK